MAVRRATAAKGKWADARSINSILTDYKAFKGVVESNALRIMGEASKIVLDFTLPLVPEETGALKESGRAQAVKTKKGVAGVVSFGGAAASVSPTKNAPEGIVDYAAIVNYDTSKAHPIGQSMFLEEGSSQARDTVNAYIVSELKRLRPRGGTKK